MQHGAAYSLEQLGKLSETLPRRCKLLFTYYIARRDVGRSVPGNAMEDNQRHDAVRHTRPDFSNTDMEGDNGVVQRGGNRPVEARKHQ